ncbi:hypothetical protein H9P43_000950 [Blastocladiella emersonii ATCC 22665]|nr:hypothetical protein H9P43_000950 [Blastocladiella emersonii ATCC 22665]
MRTKADASPPRKGGGDATTASRKPAALSRLARLHARDHRPILASPPPPAPSPPLVPPQPPPPAPAPPPPAKAPVSARYVPWATLVCTTPRAMPQPAPRNAAHFPSPAAIDTGAYDSTTYYPATRVVAPPAPPPPPSPPSHLAPPHLSDSDPASHAEWRAAVHHLRAVLHAATEHASRDRRLRRNRQRGPVPPPAPLPGTLSRAEAAAMLPQLHATALALLALPRGDPRWSACTPADADAVMHVLGMCGRWRGVVAAFHAHPAPSVAALNAALHATSRAAGKAADVLRLADAWVADGGAIDPATVAMLMRCLADEAKFADALALFDALCAGDTPMVVPDAYLAKYAAALRERVARLEAEMAAAEAEAAELAAALEGGDADEEGEGSLSEIQLDVEGGDEARLDGVPDVDAGGEK